MVASVRLAVCGRTSGARWASVVLLARRQSCREYPVRVLVFSPKGWEPSAQGNALGGRCIHSAQPERLGERTLAALQAAGLWSTRTQGSASLRPGLRAPTPSG